MKSSWFQALAKYPLSVVDLNHAGRNDLFILRDEEEEEDVDEDGEEGEEEKEEVVRSELVDVVDGEEPPRGAALFSQRAFPK
jgi:hypothetical protein